MSKSNKQVRKESQKWNPKRYPYPTSYNDHFETPIDAYKDVVPVINWLHANCISLKDRTTDNRDKCEANDSMILKHVSKPILYDPYYCHGQTKMLLDQLGYPDVVHEKRDFYQDIAENRIPHHDILITNPPYSDTHKEKCLSFCFRQLRRSEVDGGHNNTQHAGLRSTPFLLLMPSYVAAKQYYRDALLSVKSTVKSLLQSTSDKNFNSMQTDSDEDVVYIIPPKAYNYQHPEGTGKDVSPFHSVWYVGCGKHLTNKLKVMWASLSSPTKPILITSLAELEERKIISFQNRPNPKRRKKSQLKRKQLLEAGENSESKAANVPPSNASTKHISKKRKSKYRDDIGQRTRRRF